MDDGIPQSGSWFKRNWKWILPVLFVLILFTGALSFSNSKNNIANFAQAFTDTQLYENAIQKSNANEEVLSVLGKLKPIDKLAILESNVAYGNDNASVSLSVRVQGDKTTGKMDVMAVRKGEGWKYKNITIRIKRNK